MIVPERAHIYLLATSLATLGVACGDDGGQDIVDAGEGIDAGGAVDVGDADAGVDKDAGNGDPDAGQGQNEDLFVSKAGTTAAASDGSWLAATNRDRGSVTVYTFSGEPSLDPASSFTIELGGTTSEVSSIVAGHDDSYILATLQYEQRVCRFSIQDGLLQTPLCAATGSEPTSVITNAAGSRVYVANMVDGSISVYDAELNPVRTLDFSDANGETQVHPFAMLYLRRPNQPGNFYVTDFFAEKVPGGQEGSDTGRQGAVYKLSGAAADVSGATKIVLPPLEETGFRIPADNPACADPNAAGCANDTSGAFPNQLASISYDTGRLFVVSTCASPRGNIRFNMNLHSCVHVIDAFNDQEVPELRLNIQERIAQQDAGEDRLFCAVPTDMACVANSPFCYVTCGSSEIVIRLNYRDFSSASEVVAGVPNAKNLPTGRFPTGISIIGGDTTFAFVNNENSFDVTTLNLVRQVRVSETQSVALPAAGSLEANVLKGKDFFFTSRGRWSDTRWSSCVGCHPRGLTDNISWHFPTGPRQTVSMDASFSKENVAPDGFGNRHGFDEVLTALEADVDFPQRIFNWTSVRDEVADFELNVRGVSGGRGAIVDANNNPIDLAGGNAAQDSLVPGGIGNNTNNLGSTEALLGALGTLEDWAEVTDWVRTIRSPRAKTNLPGNVAAGKALFDGSLRCGSCHAGGSWTNAMRYYTPTLATNEAGGALSDTLRQTLVTDFTAGKDAFLLGKAPVFDANSACTSDADCKGLLGACDTRVGQCVSPALEFEFYASTPRGINQHACVLRNVDSYDGRANAVGALELRRDMVTPAQGEAGFNIPSLLNLQLGAPYLHNGRFETLTEFFLDAVTQHASSGSAVATLDPAGARDLVAYLLSIDGATSAPIPQATELFCDEVVRN